MSLFNHNKQEFDPSENDFYKISQEIKNDPKKLTEAQKLFKNDESRRNKATKNKQPKNTK